MLRDKGPRGPPGGRRPQTAPGIPGPRQPPDDHSPAPRPQRPSPLSLARDPAPWRRGRRGECRECQKKKTHKKTTHQLWASFATPRGQLLRPPRQAPPPSPDAIAPSVGAPPTPMAVARALRHGGHVACPMMLAAQAPAPAPATATASSSLRRKERNRG